MLMDIRMPRLNGIEAARRIRAVLPATRILMLTVSDEEDDLYEAIKAGANGYLLKEISAEEVAGAVQAVAQGHSLISPSMASKLLQRVQLPWPSRRPRRSSCPAPVLTARELEVLKLVARGMSNREVADQLYISENTVKNHMRNILEKLHLHSRMEAVMYAVRKRLLDPHHPEAEAAAGGEPAGPGSAGDPSCTPPPRHRWADGDELARDRGPGPPDRRGTGPRAAPGTAPGRRTAAAGPSWRVQPPVLGRERGGPLVDPGAVVEMGDVGVVGGDDRVGRHRAAAPS